jgi:hypothetical protein
MVTCTLRFIYYVSAMRPAGAPEVETHAQAAERHQRESAFPLEEVAHG